MLKNAKKSYNRFMNEGSIEQPGYEPMPDGETKKPNEAAQVQPEGTEETQSESQEDVEETQAEGQESPEDGESQEVSEDGEGSEKEMTPEQEITNISQRVQELEEQIFSLQKEAEETKKQLAQVRESLGVEGPEANLEEQRTESLKEELQTLLEKQNEWIQQYGEEKVPAGVVIIIADGSFMSRGENFQREEEEAEEAGISEEEKEARRNEIDSYKEETARLFEDALRKDFRTRLCANMELSISFMKKQLPKLIDAKAEDFINGDSNVPPFFSTAIKWETDSLLGAAINIVNGKPNLIKKLEISFDDEDVLLAGPEDIKPEEPESEELKETANPDGGSDSPEGQPDENAAETRGESQS